MPRATPSSIRPGLSTRRTGTSRPIFQPLDTSTPWPWTQHGFQPDGFHGGRHWHRVYPHFQRERKQSSSGTAVQWPVANVQWWVSGYQADVKLAQGGVISYSWGTNVATPTSLTVTGMDPAKTYNLIAYVAGAWYGELRRSTWAVPTMPRRPPARSARGPRSPQPMRPIRWCGNYVEFTGLTGVSARPDGDRPIHRPQRFPARGGSGRSRTGLAGPPGPGRNGPAEPSPSGLTPEDWF